MKRQDFFWWNPSGNTCYAGHSPNDGLAWTRHDIFGSVGKWYVRVIGFPSLRAEAVVDDFGNLVEVPA